MASSSSSSSSASSASAPSTSSAVAKRTCPLCSQPGIKVCAGCSKVGYCSKEHQREHWKEHKQVCEQKHKQAATASSALKSKSEEVQVTWEDQKRINTFSRLNTQVQNLQDELRTLKSDLANLNDAESDVSMLLDDNACELKIGEVFFGASNEEAEEFVTKKREEVKRETEEKEQLVATIEKQMQELRTILYGKFGKAINLENAEQTVNE